MSPEAAFIVRAVLGGCVVVGWGYALWLMWSKR